MALTALHGSDQPETHLFVTSDLLAEWLGEKEAAQRRLRTAVLRTIAALLLAIAIILPLRSAASVATASAAKANQQLSSLNERIKLAGGDKPSGEAGVDFKGMISNCQKRNASSLNSIISTFSCTLPSVALSNCKIEIIGGDLKFSGQGDADSFVSAGQFIQRLGLVGGSKGAVLSSATRTDTMGPESVSFQFTNEVKAGNP